jgi:hypothetical protein
MFAFNVSKTRLTGHEQLTIYAEQEIKLGQRKSHNKQRRNFQKVRKIHHVLPVQISSLAVKFEKL